MTLGSKSYQQQKASSKEFLPKKKLIYFNPALFQAEAHPSFVLLLQALVNKFLFIFLAGSLQVVESHNYNQLF